MVSNSLLSMILYYLFIVFILSIILPYSSCQSFPPQNLQTFYPFPLPNLLPPPVPPVQRPPPSLPPPLLPSPNPPPDTPAPLPSLSSSNTSSKKAVGTAIGVTAASTIVLSALLFFFLVRYSRRKRKNLGNGMIGDHPRGGANATHVVGQDQFLKFEGNLKGVIVDENGLDVLYWRKLESGQVNKESFKKKQVFVKPRDEEEEEKRMISKGGGGRRKSEHPIQELPLLRGKSSTSQSPSWLETENKPPVRPSSGIVFKSIEKKDSSKQLESRAPPLAPDTPSPPPPPPPPPAPPLPVMAIPKATNPPPPPPPAMTIRKGPPLPPPPINPSGMSSTSGEGTSGNGNDKVKLKPLHWDKVNANVEHSMVWDKLDRGSFKFDGDLMEALFGYVAINKKSPGREKRSPNSSPRGDISGPPSQIFILETRKSQNIAIILRSLGVTRKEIIDALVDGQGLSVETLERLCRIAPTKEEESEVVAFEGDPTRLADAESFLFHILKAVPSAFNRFNAMLFRSNYGTEIQHQKEYLQTLDLSCKELRAQRLFLKLLEAILKAGNRMNAGTSRGNAQAFKLTALRKLSDVKSIDGKTTLLHFVVQEVVRAEGKRCVLNRNQSLRRTNSQSSGSSGSIPTSKNSTENDETEKEYMMLGLPIVGGLSSEFSSVKKSAAIDYDTLSKTCSMLTAQISEIRRHLAQSDSDKGLFGKEMRKFLDAAEKEIKKVREEQDRVMELVKKTTDYYQAGASDDKGWQPLQLFAIVKDFLEMVDQVCVEITRNMQKKKPLVAVTGSSSQGMTNNRAVRFPKLPANFLSDISKSSSSSDEDS